MRIYDSILFVFYLGAIVYVLVDWLMLGNIDVSQYELQYFPDFIRGFTTAIGISVAIIVFLFTSTLREYRKEFSKLRGASYVLGIYWSLFLVFLSYSFMLRGEIVASICSMVITFLLATGILVDFLVFYIVMSYETESDN